MRTKKQRKTRFWTCNLEISVHFCSPCTQTHTPLCVPLCPLRVLHCTQKENYSFQQTYLFFVDCQNSRCLRALRGNDLSHDQLFSYPLFSNSSFLMQSVRTVVNFFFFLIAMLSLLCGSLVHSLFLSVVTQYCIVLQTCLLPLKLKKERKKKSPKSLSVEKVNQNLPSVETGLLILFFPAQDKIPFKRQIPKENNQTLLPLL